MPHIVKRNKRVRSGGRRNTTASLQRGEGEWVVHHGVDEQTVFKDEDYKPGKSKRHAQRFLATVS